MMNAMYITLETGVSEFRFYIFQSVSEEDSVLYQIESQFRGDYIIWVQGVNTSQEIPGLINTH